MNENLEQALKSIRINCFEAEKCISEKEYEASLFYIKNAMKDDSNLIFPNRIILKNCENAEEYTHYGKCYHLIEANNKQLKIVFDKRENESFSYGSNKIYLPFDCIAPSMFEGIHHAMQFSLINNSIEYLKEFHKKNIESIEKCAYYWLANIFPEHKKGKDLLIMPQNFEKILEKSPEEIIKMEKQRIY